jgi:outer membrane receptor protein involved in Fe transport
VVTDQDRYATASAPRSVERADVSASDYHVRAFGQRPIGGARLELGLDANGRFGLEALEVRQAYAADGRTLTRDETIAAVEDAHRTDAALYAAAEGRLQRVLALSGGLRVDRVTTRNSGGYFGDRSTSHAAGSGFLALSAGPFGGLTATAQAARGFRDPLLSDRYYRGPTGRGYITGEPELDPETSLQFDAGLRYATGRWRAEAHAYQYRFDDLIERYQAETDFFFFRNRGRSRIRGLEAELHVGLAGGLNASITGHVVRSESLDDGSHLDDAPPDTLTVQLHKAFGERGFVQARGALYAEDDRPGPTEVARKGYGLLDASAGYRPVPKLELRLLLRNLLDEEYLVSPDARAVLAPGLSVLLTGSLSF